MSGLSKEEAFKLLNLTPGVLAEVMEERLRQAMKFGAQEHHPDLCPALSLRRGATPERHAEDLEIPTADRAKFLCQHAFANSRGTWALIALEEFCETIEAAAQRDPAALREELIQTAAVFVAWAEAVDRRGAR